MLAAFRLINRHTGRYDPCVRVRRSSLFWRYAAQIWPADRAKAVRANSSTTTPGLRTGRSSVTPTTTISINHVEDNDGGHRQLTNDISISHLKDQRSEARGSQIGNGGEPSDLTAWVPSWRLSPLKKEEQNMNHTSEQDDERKAALASHLNGQSANAESGRRGLRRDQKPSHTAQHDRDADLRASAKTAVTDSLFEHLRNPRGTGSIPKPRVGTEYSANDRRFGEIRMQVQKEPAFYQVIRAASVEDIEQKLSYAAHHQPNVKGIEFMLKELVQIRHVQPQARHYEALILSNCEARHGSSGALYSILAEMERERIGIRASTLSVVLKVLSIHPDAHLLTSILKTHSEQWSHPSISDTTYTILALTRLNQFELALSHLETLITTSAPPNNYLQSPIPKYLYTTILYRLSCPVVSDHNAVLELLYLLTDHNLPLSPICISYLLDSAAASLHLDLTLYLWRTHVDFDYLIPSNGLCRNALLTAARHGNAELAIKAGRVLELRCNDGRERGLGVEELEMVREAFIGHLQREEEREADWVGRGQRKEKTKYKIDTAAITKLEERMMQLRKEGRKDITRRAMEMERENEMERKSAEEKEGVGGRGGRRRRLRRSQNRYWHLNLPNKWNKINK